MIERRLPAEFGEHPAADKYAGYDATPNQRNILFQVAKQGFNIDVEISVVDNRLTIKGEREEEKETKEKTMHRIERRYGSFYRSIDLPAGTSADDICAESDNGVITITLPKPPEAQSKRISVKPK